MKVNKIFKNASWIVGCKIAQALLNLIVTSLTARILGPSNFGIINYAASLVAFVVPIMQLGITNVLVREIVVSPEKEGELLGTSVTLCLVSAIFSIGGVVGFSMVANKGEKETIIVCALYSLLLISQAFEITQYWFQAKLLSKYTSITMLIAYAIVAVYRIILLVTKQSIYWFAISQAIDFILIAIGLFIIYFKLGGKRLRFSFGTARMLLAKGKYYIVSSMMVTIFAQTDKIMIKLMIDDAAVGFYSAAVTCAGLTGFIFLAIIDSMRPVIFENKEKNDDEYRASLKTLYSIVIYFALIQSVVISIFSKLIVGILYGSEYDATIGALCIIVWYTTFSYLGAVRNIWILAENKQKYLWIINLSGAILNVVLNLILIPKLGINGAAIASLATQIFTNFIIGFIIKPIRENNKIMLASLNPKILISKVKAFIKK